MVKKWFQTSEIIMLCLVLLFWGMVHLQSKPFIKSNQFLIPPPDILINLSFGFKEIMADATWIRTIQDFDYCESKINNVDCQSKGWVYRMLNFITDLSPKFRIIYATGTLTLTILVSDIEGASLFLTRRLTHFQMIGQFYTERLITRCMRKMIIKRRLIC